MGKIAVWFSCGAASAVAAFKTLEQSRGIGAKLVRVKGERIFLDQLDPNTKGRPMKTTAVECGIFCEERNPSR